MCEGFRREIQFHNSIHKNLYLPLEEFIEGSAANTFVGIMAMFVSTSSNPHDGKKRLPRNVSHEISHDLDSCFDLH